MITDREIADKRNEVKMLRLQINEHKERRRLDEIREANALREANETIHNAKTYIACLEAELSNSKSAIAMKNGVINDRNETISDLRMAGSDMLDTINECSRREAEDSGVLMQVVEIVKEWGRLSSMVSTYDMRHLRDLLVDYLDAPEIPVVTLKTPSMGTRVVPKNEETLVIDENKMEAVRMLVGSDMWVLHTDDEAVEDKQQKETINKLNALLADEKMTLAAYRSNPLSDQVADRDAIISSLRADRHAKQDIIDKLRHDSCNLNDKLNETDRLHSDLNRLSKIRDELLQLYCDRCDRLEKIEKIVNKAKRFDVVLDTVSIDNIVKIIQEE